MYAAARASEAALRETARTGPRGPSLSEYRSVVAAYEAVSRHFPSTGYADNALWQAATLSLDALERFGDERDWRTARRLLGALVDRYPSSSLSSKGRAELERLTSAARSAEPPAPARPTAVAARPDPPEPVAPPSGASRLLEVRQIRRTVNADGARVTIELESEVHFKTERIENPPRVLFDLAGTRPGATLVEGTLSYPDGIVRYIRVGRRPADVTRVVLDLTGTDRYSTFMMYDPYRIVIDFEADRPAPIPAQRISEETLAPPVPDPAPVVPAAKASSPAAPPAGANTSTAGGPAAPAARPPSPRAAAAAARAPLAARRLPPSYAALPFVEGWRPAVLLPPLTGRRLGPAWVASLASFPLRDRAALGLEPVEPPPAAPSARPDTSKPPPVVMPAPAAPLPGGFSLARQLGLAVSRVVIDPGHGGRDPGALGPGISEAAVVLDVALRLEKLLKAAGVEVVLTRRTDTYLPLEERTRVANAAQGDLFLSIHANASRNRQAEGVESYVLNFASNPDAEAVAARENAASMGNMSNLAGIVRAITLNNKLDESRGLAASVQAQLLKKLKGSRPAARDHGVKQAPFVVLIGASMPSLLVEVSFITHRQEGRLLKTASYRQRIAEALFEGIRGYQRSLKRADATAER